MLWMTLVHGSLSEQFCIWRTMIHRYSSDDGQYLYNVENSEYGIPVAAGLSYKYELFSILNDYIYDINNYTIMFEAINSLPAVTLIT